MIKVIRATNENDISQAHLIREKVYIDEQQISREDEFDEYESVSHHFLASLDDTPAAAARWRLTANGAKLERFATLSEYRGKGIASKVMEAMLDHIITNFGDINYLYLNAQVSAMPLYAKYGFKSEGDRFLECDIEHQKMVRYL